MSKKLTLGIQSPEGQKRVSILGSAKLEELYKEVVATSASCQMVVIDNLSILHCLGHSPAAVFAFLHNLRLHLKPLGIALVVRLTQLPSNPGWVKMSKLASLRAGLTIQVEALTTGQSR